MATLLALVVVGCSAPMEDVSTFFRDDIVTAVNIRFETAEDIPAYVEYGPTTDYGYSTPADAGGIEHTVPVLGLTADTTWHYRVVLQDTSEDIFGEDHTFTTLPIPAEVPPLTVEGENPPGFGYSSFTVQQMDGEIHSAAYILDSAGQIVWYDLIDGMALSAHPARDGSGMNIQVGLPSTEPGAEDASHIRHVDFATGEVTQTAMPFAHHDFVELEDGSFVSIVSDPREVDGYFVEGDALLQAWPDGTSARIWSTFDSVPLVPSEDWTTSEMVDWTHANGIAWDKNLDLFAVSLFHQEQIVFVQGDGTPRGVLGAGGDFTFVNDSGFGPQHGPRFTDAGIQLFDNAGNGVSRMVEYAIDPDAMTLTPLWSVSHPWGGQVMVMGDGVRLAGGQLLSAWGDIGDVLTTSMEGQVSRRVQTGGVVGRIDTIDSLYVQD